MADNIVAIQVGRLSLSRITFHTDLRRTSGLVIPLGVIAEMTIGTWRALGLIARTKLPDNEIADIGRVVREKVSAPFDFLKPEFDWAFAKTAPGEALSKLSERFSESLLFATPVHHEIKKALPAGAAAAEPILRDLRKERDDEFYLMLAEASEAKEQAGAGASEDTTKLAA